MLTSSGPAGSCGSEGGKRTRPVQVRCSYVSGNACRATARASRWGTKTMQRASKFIDENVARQLTGVSAGGDFEVRVR